MPSHADESTPRPDRHGSLPFARWAASALLGATAAGCTAPADDHQAIDVAGIVDDVMHPVISADATGTEQCVGAVVTVVTRDQSVVLGFGGTEARGATRPDGDTLFQIGSISKVFTGLALARLVTTGALGANDVGISHLGADLQPPIAGATFTLRDLATHHAGFAYMPANLVDRDGDGARDPDADPLSPATAYSRTDLARYLADVPPPSSTGYAYSNVGAGLLAIGLQDHLHASGFDGVLRQLVTDVLGMHDTWGEVGAMTAEATSRVARGYAVANGNRVQGHLAQMGVLAGAGEIVTTGNDIARLLTALTGAEPSALDDAVALAVTPSASGPDAETDLGYAIEIEHLADGDRFAKGGATPSFTAYLSFRRDPAVGVLVMTNCGSFMSVRELATEIDDRITALAR